MNSKYRILNCDLSTNSNLFLSDKETQTSKIFVVDTTSSKLSPGFLPYNVEAVRKDDNIKVFEFCEIIKDPDDPESVSIIKETFTEEVLTESDCIFQTPSKNKYKYCKEVIQPYSTSQPKDCPYFPKCKHKSEPCKVCHRQKQEVTSQDKEEAMNNDKCKTTFINPKKEPDNCEKKDEVKSSSCCPKKTKPEKKDCEQSKQPVCQEPFDECKLKRCISACLNESLKLAKKGSTSCLEKFEKVIGVQKPNECDEKPTFYVMEKSISRSDSSTSTIPRKNSVQSVFESQSQTVATITCAIKGFMGAVYNKTKDAVNMIKTESCKHLGLDDKTKPTSSENKTEQKTKECNSNVSEIENYDKTGQKSQIDDNNTNYGIEKILEPAKEVVGQVVSAVASTVSLLRNSSFEQIVEDIVESKMSKSSVYDNPDAGRCSPKKVAQDNEPGASSSVFTMLKAKLFSMFDIQQETCQDGDDDDDENSAEKLFEKFCEQ